MMSLLFCHLIGVSGKPSFVGEMLKEGARIGGWKQEIQEACGDGD